MTGAARDRIEEDEGWRFAPRIMVQRAIDLAPIDPDGRRSFEQGIKRAHSSGRATELGIEADLDDIGEVVVAEVDGLEAAPTGSVAPRHLVARCGLV
jgi:hypothetical protein